MNLWLIVIISLLFSAFFSGSEIAFVSSNKLKIALEKKQGTFTSKIISLFARHPGQYIATMLVGNNIALVIYGLVMALIIEPLLLKITPSEPAILLTQTLISTLIILITAEFLPKTIFRINPNLSLNIFSFPLFLFFVALFPLTWVIHRFSKFLFHTIFKTEAEDDTEYTVFNKIDLTNLVDEVQSVTAQTDEEKEPEIKIFQNALLFSKVKLRDCMIPRTDIIAMEVTSSVKQLKEKFISTGLSKILIYEKNIDDILGYVTSKEMFKKPKDIRSKIQEVPLFPETMPANLLLRKFIQDCKSIAIVVDEFGGLSGMLTIEDILEEIFGEIHDEHDTIDVVDKKINDNDYVFSGKMEIDVINEKYKLNIPQSEDYDTIAGFLIYHNENIPNTKDTIVIDCYIFTILKMDNTRIELLKLNYNSD